MAEAEEPVDGEEDAPKKKSKKGLIIGLILSLVLGGGGFFAVYSGMILAPSTEEERVEEAEMVLDLPSVSYVELDPLVISLGTSGSNKHLRFRGSLEVDPAYAEDVVQVRPRVLDVLNTYLRAVEMSDLEDPSMLVKLRAQMLRRIQLVTGEGRVRDLLILEFVLN
ncbi:flagellar basal body-associated FliL family protein [Aliiroseovarius crassostreae]|uniref:flagellar basal body-associated FliL family protein n=1 Tax=Aliiroseovarius crassostreae TaxID=154981 RepID=UPI0021B07C8E|nr:flagellar basal body-associated FliL family protein [Aliiroseovarius crassostreae]UWQ07679.1 flagellar basal body-associated FliL family protein [Aliiroseovarius crassostreae]